MLDKGTYKNGLGEIIVVARIYKESYFLDNGFSDTLEEKIIDCADVIVNGKKISLFLGTLCEYIEKYGFKFQIEWD